MSMSGSVMTFDNNNGCELGSKSKKHPTIQPKQSQAQHSGQSQQQNSAHAHDKHRHSKSSSSSSSSSSCFRAHLNSLWSVWYGLCTAGLQAYMAEQSARRFLGYASLPWPGDSPPPRLELHAHLALTGLAALMIPFFLAAAIFKVGNLANDGFKLGRHLGTCSVDPASSVALGRSGVLRSLWQHGGPTAPFLHLATAFCLLLPKLLMEARLIQAGFLPKDAIWRTDLDFMVVHRDRLVVLSFMTSPTGTTTNYSSLPTPLPFYTATPNASATAVVTSNISTTAPSLSTVRSLPFRTLQDLMSGIEPGLESAERDDDDWLGPISPEFLNYALALLVYAVRYPAVFWATNKGFGALFSMQLLANGLQSLLAYAGVCVLYKVQVLGAAEALPLYRGGAPELLPSGSPFLLNTHVTLALFVLSNVLILASSLVLYLYGYGRFNAFLSSERERRVIVLQRWSGGGIGTGSGWGYFTHCAALCVLMALAVCQAPLLYDYTVVYRGSLDGAILATAVGAIIHLFLWIVLWLFLTVKQRWIFKLRVTVGRAAVRSARSIKLVTDVDLVSGRHSSGGHDSAPLLVVGNGRTYTIADTSPKKAIMSVIQKAALDRKAKASQGNSSGGSAMDDGEEQIYWLRPKPPSPKTSPDSSDRLAWLNRKLGGSGGSKHKVTFDDSLSSTNSRKGKSLLAKSPKTGSGGKIKGKSHQQAVTSGKRGAVGLDQLTESEEDDGDYATLREIPLLPNDDNDTLSEDNKLLDSALQDDNVTYARTNRDLTPGDYEDPSPLITPEPSRDLDEDLDLPPPPTDPNTPTNSNATSTAATVTVHNNNNDAQQQQQQQQPQQATPRCLRRADSGMPHDELTPRSDSVSTESSGSGGSPPSSTGNHSETSSGVHSNSSGSDKQAPAVQSQQPNNPRGRSTSVDDLSGQPVATQNWRSFSLQRNVQPPTSATVANISPPPPIFAFHPDATTNATVITAPGGVPAVLLESSTESTVVIRRKASRPKTTDGEVATDPPVLKDEPFSRSTNMRMTSFTDNPDHNTTATPSYPSSSATLPHYPTQPHVAVAAVYPHCSTMPLPSSAAASSSSSSSNGGTPTQVGNGGSCHSFPRHHTTIPTHHNGVRLFAGPNPFVKRFPPFHHQGNGLGPVVAGRVVVAAPVVYGTVGNSSGNTLDGGHHTFPSQVVKYSTPQHCRPQDRDSANFSMASSGDSDQYLPHHA